MTGLLLALALRLLPAGRSAWGEAMRADFLALESAGDRRRFALGCLRVALLQGGGPRIGAYLAAEGTALAAAVKSGMGGAFLVEVIGLILLAPPVVWWIARSRGSLPVASGRPALLTRRAAYVLIASGAVAGVAYLATALAPHQDGASAAAFWTGIIVFLLAGYTVTALAVTSAPAGVSGETLAAGSGFGAAAGLVGFALVPFTQSYAVANPLLATVYATACALVAVGTPAASAFVASRRSGDLVQGVTAGTIAGGVAALVLFIVGLATLRTWPGLLDSSAFGRGANWLPSDPTADAEGYLIALLLIPLAALPIARLGAGLATARPRSWSLTGAVAGLGLAGLLCFPLQHTLFDAVDSTSFGAVGTTSVSFSAGGRALLTSNADQVSVLWDLATPGRPARTATFPGNAVFAPDGRTIATRGRLWGLTGVRATLGAAFGDQGDPQAFSADGRLLAVEDANGGNAGDVWDMTNRAHPKHVGSFTGQWAAFSPDGRTFATSAPCWWDSRPDVTACGTTLWSVTPGTPPARLATIGGGEAVFSPDGRTVATRAPDSTVVLWKLADRSHPRHIATLRTGTDDDPPSLVFSPDSRLLATGGEEGVVRVWDVADPSRDVTLPPARPFPNSRQIGVSSTLTRLAFSDRGRTLTTVMGNDLVTRWNMSDPRHPVRTAVLTRETRGAGVLAFSPDATRIAGAATDGSNHVSIWPIR